jgi:hypothetical protein
VLRTAATAFKEHEMFLQGCLARLLAIIGVVLIAGSLFSARATGQSTSSQQGQTADGAAKPVARTLGTIQTISGKNIVLVAQASAIISVTVEDGARILRIEPGEKDLKNASAITLQDLQIGDRILVFGTASEDAKSFSANRVVAMKKMDIDAKQQKDRDDWQKRGVGGLVTATDKAAGTITISITSFAGTKPLVIQTTKNTILRRYAPDSVKFDDAKQVTIEQIKPGDQLRARGTRSEDGASLAAEEIVGGSFRNIAGTVSAIDTPAGTMTLVDLATKQPLTVKVTADSEVRKLPLMMAQGIAARLKGPAAGTPASGGQGQVSGAGGTTQAGTGAGNNAGAQTEQGGPGSAGSQQRRGGGAAGFQQMVDRMPPSKLTDFQKGDAVMIVSTEGTDSGAVTAITLLGGVEPILAATPKGGQPMALSPWSLGGGGEGGDAGGNQ